MEAVFPLQGVPFNVISWGQWTAIRWPFFITTLKNFCEYL